MKLNYFALVLSLTSIASVHAASRNLCDDLVDSGSSNEQIEKCQAKFGVSDYYKEQQDKKKAQDDAKKVATDKEAQNKNNLEVKVFSKDDLADAGFGKPFFAIKGDYRNRKYSEERLTRGDDLCVYLGYEKALKSVVSQELWDNKKNPDNSVVRVNGQGLVIDHSHIGIKYDPELYKEKEGRFTIRKYTEITCIRRKDKTIEASNDALKRVTEDLVFLNDPNEGINSTQRDSSTSINNDSRAPKKETRTPYGYQAPDWMKDDSSSTSK
jgi:hypothetical protein